MREPDGGLGLVENVMESPSPSIQEGGRMFPPSSALIEKDSMNLLISIETGVCICSVM